MKVDIEKANQEAASRILKAKPTIVDISAAGRDSLRLRIAIPGTNIYDVSGWYFTIKESGRQSTGTVVLNPENTR